MIHYALTTFTTGHEQALDVLRSGLASQADPERGMQAGRWVALLVAHMHSSAVHAKCSCGHLPNHSPAGTRLYLTMAELERERSNWVSLDAA